MRPRRVMFGMLLLAVVLLGYWSGRLWYRNAQMARSLHSTITTHLYLAATDALMAEHLFAQSDKHLAFAKLDNASSNLMRAELATELLNKLGGDRSKRVQTLLWIYAQEVQGIKMGAYINGSIDASHYSLLEDISHDLEIVATLCARPNGVNSLEIDLLSGIRVRKARQFLFK